MQEQLIFILEVEHHARDVFSFKKTKSTSNTCYLGEAFGSKTQSKAKKSPN